MRSVHHITDARHVLKTLDQYRLESLELIREAPESSPEGQQMVGRFQALTGACQELREMIEAWEAGHPVSRKVERMLREAK